MRRQRWPLGLAMAAGMTGLLYTAVYATAIAPGILLAAARCVRPSPGRLSAAPSATAWRSWRCGSPCSWESRHASRLSQRG